MSAHRSRKYPHASLAAPMSAASMAAAAMVERRTAVAEPIASIAVRGADAEATNPIRSRACLEADNREDVVSFDDESLVLVDESDREIGYLSKAEAHLGHGQLHRAFSLFVFDERGRLLMQRRALSKRLWPNYWSNTCCSHPRRGEAIDEAIHRRLHEELGLRCALEFLFKFQYQAQFDDAGAEHELCWVFEGCSNDPPQPNGREIADIRYIEPAALDLEMRRHPRSFTPWFKQEWARMRRMRNLRA